MLSHSPGKVVGDAGIEYRFVFIGGDVGVVVMCSHGQILRCAQND